MLMTRFPLRFFQKAAGVLLALCMLFSAASAGGLDSLAPMLSDFIQSAEQGQPLDITLSATLHQLVPYGEDTLKALNSLLAGVKLKITCQNAGGTETVKAQLVMGDTAALDFTQRGTGDQTLLQTSLLPGTIYASASATPMETLFDEQAEAPTWITDVPDLNTLFLQVTAGLGSLKDFVQEKKVSYKLTSVGTAKKALVYTVPEESAQLVKDALSQLFGGLPFGDLGGAASLLQVTGNTVVTLYQSAEGENMGLSIKGVMAYNGGSFRKVSFLWGVLPGGEKTVHTLSLKAPAVKGSDSLTVTGKYILTKKAAQNSLSLSLDIKNILDKKTDKIVWAGELSCLVVEDNQRLEGEVKRTHTSAEGTVDVYSIKPGVTVIQTGGTPSLQGNVRIAFTQDKRLQSDVTVSVAAAQADAPAWEASLPVVSLDGMSQDTLDTLREKAQNASEKAILQAVLTLDPDTLTLISSNITQEDWERIYKDLDLVTQ